MILCDTKLHGHLQETPHHQDVRVIGRGQCSPQVLIDFLDAFH